jgi:hypothetical protein
VSALLNNLVHFGQVLHAAGLDVPAGRMVDVARALEHIGVGRRTDFYFTLRSLLVHRPQDFPLFDEAFRIFWRRPPGDWSTQDLRAMGEQRRVGPPEVEIPPAGSAAGHAASADTLAAPLERVAAMSYSDREVFRAKDFAEFTEAELEDARTAVAALTWDAGTRRTRRWTPGRGRAIDLRRIVRHNAPFGGEPIALPRRERTTKPRPLVLLCDVSGSMERYARLLLHFVHGVSARAGRVETFLFATRLTRVTRDLTRRNRRRTMQRLPWNVPDWGGGTRIGEALRTFNTRWARRVMGRGPVVLLISDGWDRGEPGLLRGEMARLQRSCHRLIWLNPLLGSADYRPMTRGMQAALPFVDDFLPVHNLESLDALARHLNQLPRRRARRARAAQITLP